MTKKQNLPFGPAPEIENKEAMWADIRKLSAEWKEDIEYEDEIGERTRSIASAYTFYLQRPWVISYYSTCGQLYAQASEQTMSYLMHKTGYDQEKIIDSMDKLAELGYIEKLPWVFRFIFRKERKSR